MATTSMECSSGQAATCVFPHNASAQTSPGLPAAGMVPGDNLGPSLRDTVWVLVGLSFVFLVTRLYCKFLRHRALHIDDSILIASWVMLLGSAICTTLEIGYGFGRHAMDIHTDNIDAITLTGQIAITLSICAQSWSKTSWAVTLLRVSTGHVRGFMWFALVSMNLFFAGPALGYWVQCQPLEKAWHPQIEGTCWSPRTGIVLGIVASCYSGIMDLVFAIIPWLLLRHLQINPTEKLGVAVAMSMGVFAAVCAFIKSAAMPSLQSTDFSYTGVTLTQWGVAEPAVTIMAASVPMMRVLVQTVRRRKSYSEASDNVPASTPTSPLDVETTTTHTRH